MMLLREILEHNQASAPTGAPLYRYRLTPQHRTRLREALQSHCGSHKTLQDSAAAMFCLYVADQLRQHGGGTWAWGPVTDPLGWQGPYAELTDGVSSGLSWWRRPLLVTPGGRRFLGTLVLEGGGPLALLRDAESEAPLRGFLRRLLADRERFQRPAADLVRENRALLSEALRREPVPELLALLIEHTAALRVKLRDAAVPPAADPITALDQLDPGWRDRFPLDLADDLARVLLQGLLREPAPGGIVARTVPTVETRLEGAGPWSIVREVTLPRSPDANAFLRSFGHDGEPPGRVRLVVERSDGTRVPVATAMLRQGDAPTYSFERSKLGRLDDPKTVREPIALVALAGSRELGRMSPPGGEALEDDPWTFLSEEPRKLLGTSSLRTRNPSAWVAWCADRTTATPASESSWHRVGTLDLEGAQRELFALSGSVELRGTDVDQISTGDMVEDDWWYLQGRTWTGPGRFAGIVFLGVPGVHGLDPKGISHALGSGSLTWRREGSAQPPVPAIDGCLGRGTLELRRGGRVALRTRVLLLPQDLSVELKAAPQENQGSVRVRSTALIEVGVDPVPGMEVDIQCGTAEVVLQVRRQTPEVQTLTLTLRLRGVGDVRLTIDFPARWVGCVRGFEGVLPPKTRCSLERLSQIRVVARSHNPHDRFALMAREPGVSPWSTVARLGEGNGRREIFLDAIADELATRLAQTKDLNSVVELGILCTGQPLPKKVLEVGHFDRHFDPVRDDEGCVLSLRESSAATQYAPSSIRLEARPLLEPQAEPQVPVFSEGTWRFAYADHAPGPWLLLGWRDDRLAIRPLLITVPSPADSPPPTYEGLRGAAAHRTHEARSAALGARFAMMVSNPGDGDWIWVDDHIATLQALPAITFDVVRALVRVPEAAVMAWMRAVPVLRDKVWDAFETLAFLWEVVPTVAWKRVLERIHGNWDQIGETLEPRGFGPWFKDLLRFADERSRTMRIQLEIAAAAMGHAIERSTLAAAHGSPVFCQTIRDMLEDGAFKVRRRHNDPLEWPDADITAAVERVPGGERLSGHEGYQDLVIHGPLVAAVWSFGRPSLAALAGDGEASMRTSLRRARDFDPLWFDEATACWITRLLLCNP